MLHTERILVATDFSGPAERARRQAEYLAATHDAALHVLHVTRDAELAELFEALPADKMSPRRAQVYLAEWLGHPIEPPSAFRSADRRRPSEETWTVRHETSLVEGILDYARAIDADLLIVGAGRPSGRSDGVATTVVRRAQSPVITVPPSDRGDDAPRIPRPLPRRTIRRLLVPVDFSSPTDSLVQHACALAAQSNASIDLVHVLESSSLFQWSARDGAPQTAAQAHRTLATLAQRDAAPAVTARCRVLNGAPAPAIVQYADEQRVDLILMGTHGRTGWRRMMLGSVAETVIQTASCPVATIKAEGRSLLRETDRAAVGREEYGHARRKSPQFSEGD
jgi:nucleotide-binding universal stress UspA family protein